MASKYINTFKNMFKNMSDVKEEKKEDRVAVAPESALNKAHRVNTRGKKIKISKGDVAVALDDSWSTGQKTDAGETVITRQMSRVYSLVGATLSQCGKSITMSEHPMVLWGRTARLVKPMCSGAVQHGGTIPVTIMKDQASLEFVQSRDVFVLVTDGEIGRDEVANFAKASQETISDKSLVVGIIITRKRPPTPAKVNASVVATLVAMGANVLIMVDDGFQSYLALASGDELRTQLAKDMRPPPLDEDTTWEQLPVVGDVGKLLLGLRFAKIMGPQLEPNEVITHQREVRQRSIREVYTVVPEKILTASPSDLAFMIQSTMLKWDVSAMEMRAKVLGTTTELRKMFVHLKSVGLGEFEKQLRAVSQPADGSRNKAMQLLREMYEPAFQSIAPDVKAEVRSCYAEAVRCSNLRSIKDSTFIGEKLRPFRRFLEGALSSLSETEQRGWAMGGVAKGPSNRATRADMAPEFRQQDLLGALNDPSVVFSKIECSICYEENVPAAMLVMGQDVSNRVQADYFLQNYAIDNPLACGDVAVKMFSTLPCCWECAKFFMLAGEDGMRRPVAGVFPLLATTDSLNKDAWKSIRSLFNKCFTRGLAMHHTPFTALAGLDCIPVQSWTTDTLSVAATNMVDVLASKIMTTPTFSGEGGGTKVTLHEAVSLFLFDAAAVRNRPFRMLGLCIRYYIRVHAQHGVVDGVRAGRQIARVAYTYFITRQFVALSKAVGDGGDGLTIVQDMFDRIAFTTCGGIPIHGQIHPVSCMNDDLLKTLFGADNFRNVQQDIRRLGQVCECKDDEILDPAAVVFLLHTLLKFPDMHQKRFGQTVDNLVSSDPRYSLMVSSKVLDSVTTDTNKWMNWVDDSVTGQYAEVGEEHLRIPPYAIYNSINSGPSTTTCQCGYLFLPRGTYASLELAVKVIRTNRKLHFDACYGSEYPNDTSAHVNLHRVVAQAYEDEDFKEWDQATEKAVVDRALLKFKDTRGMQGNIYSANLLHDVQTAAQFMHEVASTGPNYSLGVHDKVARSVAFKLACELHMHGLYPVTPTGKDQYAFTF